jgi:parvulin-like peptidyl-prolyl isomerase
MTMRRSLALFALALAFPLSSCKGLKDAMSAHTDTVAKAASQELSVERLGTLLGQSQAPISKETARAITDLWVNYQLVAEAAAKGDSLSSPALADSALSTVFSRMVVDKWYRGLQPTFLKSVDTSSYRKRFDAGEAFAASHILITVPQTASPAQKAELKAKATAIRAKLTAATFAATAAKESGDPGSAQKGGVLGVFPKGVMVPAFEQGLAALKPGEISQPIETQFGFHIIRRGTYEEAREELGKFLSSKVLQEAESTYVTKLEKDAQVDVKATGVATLRAVAANLPDYTNDKTTIASLKGGDFTAANLAALLMSVPQRGQLMQQISGAPDSVVREQLLKPIVRTEVVLRAAKASGTKLDTAEMDNVRRTLGVSLAGAWNGLTVPPGLLADSAKAPGDRGKLAAARVETVLERIIAGQAPLVQVPPPLERALKIKFSSSVNPAGIDRAVERAKQVRSASDSAKAKAVPPSAVPIPGVPGAEKALPTTPNAAPAPAGAAPAAPATKKN